MKRLLAMAAAALSFMPISSRAASLTDAGVPHTINLQSIVYDSSGNITKSDKVDVSVKILDADSNVVFSEDHGDVQVIEGAINVDIGSESGGVPLEVLDPTTGSKLIDVMIDGSNPFDIMPLGAVPYAMWAEKSLSVANDSIGTEQIKNGSIKAEDIDPLAFSDLQGQAAEGQLPDSVTMDTELNAHVTSPTAHPASAIVVSGPFINMVALNVQEGLQKLDVKLAEEMVNRMNAVSAANASITTLQGQMATVTADLSGKVLKSGDTMTGNLTMNGGNIVMSGSETVDGVDVSNLQSQVDGHETRIAALEGAPQTTCSISIYSGIIDDGDACDCNLYGMVVDFGGGATALSGLASITNNQDNGVSEKSDQNNVIAVKDDTGSKMLFLLAHACDSHPSFGGMAIGIVPSNTCPASEAGTVSATFLMYKGDASGGNKGSCYVNAGDIAFARGAL